MRAAASYAPRYPERQRGTFSRRRALDAVAAAALVAWRRPAPAARQVVRFGIQLPSGQRLYSRRMDLPEPVPIPGSDGASLPFFSPDEQWLGFVQGTKLVKVGVAGGPITPICTAPSEVFGATWTAGDSIVFGSDSGLMDVPAAGGVPRVVARPDSGESFHFPEVLPGDRSVVFGVARSGMLKLAVLDRRTGKVKRLNQQGGYPRYVAGGFLVLSDPAGIVSAVPFDAKRLEVTGPARPIADKLRVNVDGDFNLGVSRAGDLAYQASASEGQRLMLLDRAGTARSAGADSGFLYTPSFAPDGRRIAFLRATEQGYQTRDIWVFDLVQHTQTRVTFDTTATWPVWSPDGRRIVYTRLPDGSSAFRTQLFWVPADGSGSPEPLGTQPGQWKAAAFEPGGGGIVYSGRPSPQAKAEIWRVGVDSGSAPVQVLATPFNNAAPSLSPDGRWLAYTADESGRDEVYVRSYPGAGGRWQVSLEGGAEPIWSPQGNEIFYRNVDAMMAAAVRTKPTFEVTGRSQLFTGQYQPAGFRDQNYSVTRDGRMFAMLERVVGTRQALVVTLNWFDQFRTRK